MIARWAVFAAALAALAFAAGASAQAPAPLTYGQIRALSPRDLAARLLGPDRAADVERTETRLSPSLIPGTLDILFFHRPVPLGQVYCRQEVHRIGLSAIEPFHAVRQLADDDALNVGEPTQDTTIARAPSCRVRQGQQFATLDVEMNVAMSALNDLAAAQAAAAGHNRLAFRLSCGDEVGRDPDKCRQGARAVLAHLPLHLACFVGLEDFDNPRVLEITLCPEVSQWRVTMRDFGTRRARLAMSWEDIPPF